MKFRTLSITCAVVFITATLFCLPLMSSAGDGQFYTVKKGDTLWDISAKFLKNPMKWPSLWHWNPYIPNPHLIYPGDVVKITATGIELVERAGKKVTPPPVKAWPVPEQEQELIEQWTPPVVEQEPPAPKVIINRTPLMARRGHIVDEDSHIEATIVDGTTGKELLSVDDKVFISFDDPTSVSSGERYTVYETLEKIFHPVTKKFMGYLTENAGSVVILDAGHGITSKRNKDATLARIDRTDREIEVGMHLKKYEELLKEVEIKETTADIDAYVVTSINGTTAMGITDIFIMDKGEKDGLVVGNLVQIYKDRDPLKDPHIKKGKLNLPRENVGVAIVVEVSESTALCSIISENQVVNNGYRVRSMGPVK